MNFVIIGLDPESSSGISTMMFFPTKKAAMNEVDQAIDQEGGFSMEFVLWDIRKNKPIHKWPVDYPMENRLDF